MNEAIPSPLTFERRPPATQRLLESPGFLAGVMTAVYLLLSSTYIVVSDRLAARVATSMAGYGAIQTAKGLLFVGLTALLFFLFAFLVFRALAKRRRQIIRQARALVVAEQRAQSGIFAASVAHDIRNILMVLAGRIEFLDEEPDLPSSARQEVATIRRSGERLQRLVGFLADVGANRAPGEREEIDLAPVLDDVARFARAHQEIGRRRFKADIPESLPCLANHHTITRAVLNLLINAADATGPGGRIDLDVAVTDDQDVIITIDDDGPGVPRDQREQVFREFYTTKPHGNGLGLVSVKYCAHEHGGTWGLETSPLGGARFYLRFPQVRPGGTPADSGVRHASTGP